MEITASITVQDKCDPNPIVRLVSIKSSEVDNAQGDGNTLADIEGAALGTEDRRFPLGAKRGRRWPRVQRHLRSQRSQRQHHAPTGYRHRAEEPVCKIARISGRRARGSDEATRASPGTRRSELTGLDQPIRPEPYRLQVSARP